MNPKYTGDLIFMTDKILKVDLSLENFKRGNDNFKRTDDTFERDRNVYPINIKYPLFS